MKVDASGWEGFVRSLLSLEPGGGAMAGGDNPGTRVEAHCTSSTRPLHLTPYRVRNHPDLIHELPELVRIK